MKKTDYWQESLDYLCNKDKKLAKIIEKNRDYTIINEKSALESLLGSIVSQQISVKAAASIWQKIVTTVGEITPSSVLEIGVENLRLCGLSNQKAQYFVNIAQHFQDHQIIDKSYWDNRDYADVYKELIQIKGVGPWTIDMFGMIYLDEKDIFPLKDLGIVRAIHQLYAKDDCKLNLEQMQKIGDNWRPYRTVASLFLWRSVDD